MPTESDDPRDIRSIAVTAEDVITAAETNRTSDRTAVLRVTPPFSGRMRARLHVRLHDDPQEAGAIHVPPGDLLDDGVPVYPRPAATEDKLRSDPELEYSVDNHREYHEQAVEEWRDAIADAIVDSVPLSTDEGPHDVTVHVLG
jgi:hypothetical protein